MMFNGVKAGLFWLRLFANDRAERERITRSWN